MHGVGLNEDVRAWFAPKGKAKTALKQLPQPAKVNI
jgi:hypothetical protein